MSSLGSPNPFFIAGKKAYEIERSLRFNDNDNAYLTRTPSGVGNRKIWTLSVWVKRSTVDANQRIFTAYDGSNNNAECSVQFQSDGKIQIHNNNTSSNTDTNLKTNSLFRDPSAWYHIVVATDMTQGTAANRVNLYINGEQETSFSTESYGTQNVSWWFANNSPQTIGRRPTSERYFDGYMTEFNFIDGLQLTPSSFGATDAVTGQWNPKKYGGGYGTNGFYLNFSDNSGTSATTLGKDSSGNGNNFTPNNFSVSAGAGNDSLEDTPTNNFATMNPLVPSPTVTWSNGNLDLAGSSSSQYSQNNTSTFGVSSGKWYAEVKYTYSGTTNAYMGICPITAAADANMTGSVTDAAVLRMNNETYIEGTSASSGTSIDTSSSGYIIGIALDMDNQKVWFSVQGTYINSGNPSTGANATFDGITAGETIAICARPLNNTLNFNFGQRDFEYTPPTGFKKLNSANLPDPTIKLPNQHFDTLLWSGNSTNNRAITGLNFQPDFVWMKKRTTSAAQHSLVNSIVGTSDNGTGNGNVGDLDSASTRAEAAQSAGGFESFDANGFTLGKGNNDANADSAYQLNNASSMTYVGWNWNAGDTDGKTYTVTVVDDSGNKFRFDGFGTSAVTLDLAEGGTYVFNYPSAHPFRFSTTSDGTHGGGSEYTTGVTHNSSTQVTIVVAASAPTLYYYCSSHSGMGGQVNTNSTLGSSNFDGSIQSTVKANATAGFSIVTYTGNGSTATIGHGLGVAPKAVIVKRRSGSDNWQVYWIGAGTERSGFLSLNNAFSTGANTSYWGTSVPTSTVFSVANSTQTNGSSETYVAYVFSSVEGYSKFGEYTGNGSTDGPFVFTGFRPAFLLWKNSSSTRNWHMIDNTRDTFNPVDLQLYPNLNSAEYAETQGYDFLSNGFKIRESANFANNNGGTYIYLAFAKSPFKNARAR